MTTTDENKSPKSPKIDNLNHNFNPKMLKLEYGRICKRYDVLCNTYRKLEKSYQEECLKTSDLRLELISLKSTEFVLSDKKTTQTDSDDPDDLKWWKDNEINLNKAELESYVKLVNSNNVLINKLKTENCNLKKQHRYIEFKNNLIEKKLKFRDGTLEMVKSIISGETNVIHPDYTKGETAMKEPTLTEKCMAIAKTRSELRKLKVECENYVDTKPDETSVIELKSPLEDEPKYLSCTDYIKDNVAEPLKPNVNLEIIDKYSDEYVSSDSSYDSDDSNDSDYSNSSNDSDDTDDSDDSMPGLISVEEPVVEKSNYHNNDNITNTTEPVYLYKQVPECETEPVHQPGVKQSVTVDTESLNNCYYTSASFKTVFPKTTEHVFRNSCLAVLYGSVPSSALWNSDTCYFDIAYWDGFDENQSHQIIYSLWNNYSNYYGDLKDRITTLQNNVPEEYSNNNQSYKYILKDIVNWLFA